MNIFVLERVENKVADGEITHYEQFLIFSKIFKKVFFRMRLKEGKGYRVKKKTFPAWGRGLNEGFLNIGVTPNLIYGISTWYQNKHNMGFTSGDCFM